MRREGGADARVVGHHLVALVDETLVPDLPEQPPHRFDVGVVERVVGISHVHPEPHALGHALPVADVAHHRFAAPPGELGHPDLTFDLGLVEDPELLLDLVLDRQAVGVPSGLARAVVALHVLEAGEDVLEGAGEDMVDAGPPVGGRWSFVPAVERPALARALRRVEHVVLAPQGEYLLFELHAVVAARHVRQSRGMARGGSRGLPRSSSRGLPRGPSHRPIRRLSRCPFHRRCSPKTTTPRGPMRCEPSRARALHRIPGRRFTRSNRGRSRGTTRFRPRLATRASHGHCLPPRGRRRSPQCERQ